MQLHLTCLNLGHIKNLVNESKKILPSIVNNLSRFYLFFIQILRLVIHKILGEEKQTVQRGSQLMRHIRKEIGLVSAFSVQFFRLGNQFPARSLYSLLFFFQSNILLFQLCIGILKFRLLLF